VPFLVSLGIGLVFLLIHPRIAWTGADWGALAMILVGAFIYIGLFFGLGLLVSTLHASSGASILTSLFLWVLFVLVVPNLSPYVGSLLRPAPSIVEVNRQIDRLQDTDRDDLGRKLEKERREALVKAEPILEGVERMNEAALKARIAQDPDFGRAYDLYRRMIGEAWREANVVQGAKVKVLRDDLEAKEKSQTALSVNLSMISPMASFTYFSVDLTHSGMRNLDHFYRGVVAYFASYGEYMNRKMAEMRKADPTMDVWNTATNVSDMPRFIYREESLGARIEGVFKPLVILLGMALAIFVGAVLTFNRTDPR
jgi:ABC-type transport system involved in multi-copper enzyme maturation permease subunit